MSKVLNKMRENIYLILHAMDMVIFYDSSTLVIEKLYAAMLHLEQPFYYKHGCFYEKDGDSLSIIDPYYSLERLEISENASTFYKMLENMGSYNGCSFYYDFIPNVSKQKTEQHIKDYGLVHCMEYFFDDSLPGVAYKDDNFTSYVLEQCTLNEGDISALGYILISTQKNISPTLHNEMFHLFGLCSDIFYFTEHGVHYFLYFFSIDNGFINEYITINPMIYLSWIEEHGGII